MSETTFHTHTELYIYIYIYIYIYRSLYKTTNSEMVYKFEVDYMDAVEEQKGHVSPLAFSS
jgi:hypothetical protein